MDGSLASDGNDRNAERMIIQLLLNVDSDTSLPTGVTVWLRHPVNAMNVGSSTAQLNSTSPIRPHGKHPPHTIMISSPAFS